MYPSGQFVSCTNGYVEHLITYLIFLAHLVCLTTKLLSHFNIYNHPLSVLIHLVCLITEPNGFISSDNLFCHCLSVHSYLVCFYTVLNVFYVQIDI